MYNPNAGYGHPLPFNISPQMAMDCTQLLPQIFLHNHFSMLPRQMNGCIPQQGSQECNNNNNNYFKPGQQNGLTSDGFIYGQPSPPYSTSPALSQNSSTYGDNYRGGNLPQGQCNSDTEVGRTSTLTARPPSSSPEQCDFVMQNTQHYENYNNRSLPDTQNNVGKKVAEQKENRQKKEYKKRSNLAEKRMSNATGESGPLEEQYMNFLMRENEVEARKMMYRERRQQVQQQRLRQRQQQQEQDEIQQLPQPGQDTSADTYVDENILDENTLSPMNDAQQDSLCNENSDDASETEGGGTAPVKKIDENAYKTEPGWVVPKLDKKGEVCMHKCKECKAEFETKVKMWNHLRERHIEPAKIVECMMDFCAFVTDVKHHLAYHMCLHTGERKFKCDQCEYRCINKAMLKSHKKSHSPNYEYHCADCPSRSKFHHAIKQHLEETGHRQGLTYDEDGNLCDKVIDVHGKRRGPRKATKKKSDTTVEPAEAAPVALTSQTDPQPSVAQTSPLTQSEVMAYLQTRYQSPPATSTSQTDPQPSAALPLPLTQSEVMAYLQTRYQSPPATSTSQTDPQPSAALPLPLTQSEVMTYLQTRHQSPPVTSTSQTDRQPSGALPLPLTQSEVMAYLQTRYHSPPVVDYQMAVNFDNIPAQVQHKKVAPLDLSKTGSNTNAIDLRTTTVEIHSRPFTAEIHSRPSTAEIHSRPSTAEIHSRPSTAEIVATPTENSPRVSGASRRKGKAVKCVREQVKHENHEFSSTIAIKKEPVVVAEEPEPEIGNYYCQHCQVSFGFQVLYNEHMRYHTIGDPSKCNLCHKRYDNALSFYRHIGIEPHNL